VVFLEFAAKRYNITADLFEKKQSPLKRDCRARATHPSAVDYMVVKKRNDSQLISRLWKLSGGFRFSMESINRVVVASPPGRYSLGLVECANTSFVISRRNIAKSLLPQEITKADDYILRCLHLWK
jgi:hypothetical protein